jgi:outer membrane lipoprotein carrier protein
VRQITSAIVLLLVWAASSGVEAESRGGRQPSASELAARVQARYETIRDFTADFTLTTTSPLSIGGGTDKGKVLIKKPVRMRWTLQTGSQHEVVADGTTLYNYFPRDKLVNVVELKDQTSSALLLLTGRGDLTRDFTPSLAPEQPPGEWRLTLKPRTPQPDYMEITLSVERTSLRLLGLDILDDQGTVRKFRFSNLRENQGLPDSAFAFRMPSGVEIQK